jgi:ribosome-associated protein
VEYQGAENAPVALRNTGEVTSTDDVAGDLPVSGDLVVPAAALSWRFSRSSGPGGQGVNTADSRVELSVAPLELPGLTDPQRARLAGRLGERLVDGLLTIVASEHRQQLRNRQAARDRLAAVLRAALAPPPPARRRTRPTRASRERRIEAKKQRGELKRLRRRWD